MDDAGAVEQQVERRQRREQGRDRAAVEDVEARRSDARDAGVALEQRRVDVGRPDLGTLGGERQRARPPDALSRRGHEGLLALQSHGGSSR